MFDEDGSVKKRTVRSISWVGISVFLLSALSLAKGVILARILTPEVFGIMAICLMVIRGYDIFTETGFYTALIQRREGFDNAKDTAFTLMAVRGVVLAVLVILTAPLVANYYEEEILDVTLKVIAITFVLAGFYNVSTISLQRELKFRKLEYLKLIQGVFDFVVVVGLAWYLKSVWALVIGHVTSCFLGVVLSYMVVPGRPRFHIDTKIAVELFHYGKYITGLSAVIFLTTEIDNVVISKVYGLEVLGYYVLAYMVANLPATHISKVVSRVLFPAYSSLQNDLGALQDAVVSVLRLVALISVPAAAGLAVLAPEIIGIVYGEKWLPAVGPLVILSAFGVVRAIGALNGYVYNAIGRPKITFYVNLAKLVAILAVIYPLTVSHGLIGASLAVTVPMVVQYLVEIYILRLTIKISYTKIFKALWTPMLYSGGMCAVILVVKDGMSFVDLPRLLLLVGGGMLLYVMLSHREIVLQIKRFRATMSS